MSQKIKNFYDEDLQWCHCGSAEEALSFMKRILQLLHARAVNENADERRRIGDELRETLCLDKQPGLFWSYQYMLDAAGLTEHGTSIHGSWLTDKGKEILAALESEDEEQWLESEEPASASRGEKISARSLWHWQPRDLN